MLTKSILATKNLDKGCELVKLDIDYILINDTCSVQMADFLHEKEIICANKIIIAIDHDTPSGSVKVSTLQRKLINFAKKYETLIFNGEGIGYQLLLDKIVQPGNIIVGTGNHFSTLGAKGALALSIDDKILQEVLTKGYLPIAEPKVFSVTVSGKIKPGVTIKDAALKLISDIANIESLNNKIIEFSGEGLEHLTFSEKITLCNLAKQTGAMGALVTNDNNTDSDFTLSLDNIESVVTKPGSFENVCTNELSNIKVNEVFIGGCSSGRIEDLRLAANLIKDKKVARQVRLLVAPATNETYAQAAQEGIIETFIDAGAVIMNQGCSVCWGKSQGILDDNEVLLSAASYNDKGRAGADTASIYLCSVITAVESATAGYICNSLNNGV